MALVQQTGWAQNNTGLLGEWEETDYSDFEITHEFFTPNGTAASGSGGYDMTGYIPVKDGDIIVFSGERSPGIPFVMGYADNTGKHGSVLLGNFDAADYSNLSVREEDVIIPAGISYVRCSARNTSLPSWAGRNMTVIKRSTSSEPSIVHVLAMGNSFTIDAMESCLFAVARAAGIRLVLGNACWGGFSIEDHYKALVTDSICYEYRKYADGEFDVSWGQSTRLSTILSDEPWDVVVFQQTSHFAGFYETYEPSLTNLINGLKGYFPNAKYGLHMIWTYSQDSKNPKFANYNRDQMFMYNSIVDATRKTMEAHPELEFLIPTGTAIQNLRTSFVGDNLNRDGSHLTVDLGRATAAYSWYAALFGEEMTLQNTYTPYNLNAFSTAMAKKTVLDAMHNPYSITPQDYPEYTGDNTIVPDDINFNFSHWGTETDGWNDVALQDEFACGYKDVKGRDCGIILRSSDHFCSANTSGVSQTETPLGMPADVSQTALVGYSEGEFSGLQPQPAATLQFQHLNKSIIYDFTFFASRAGVTDNRETLFTLTGKDTLSVTLDASSNKAETATIFDVCPDDDGCITLTIQAGPNNNDVNKFYYLNALRISPHSPYIIEDWEEADYSEFEITHEFFTPNGIAKSSSGGYDITGYIPVKEGDVIVFSGDRSPGIPFLMGYTDREGNGATVLLGNFDATDLSDIRVTNREVTIPAGIAYVRCSARNTSLSGWASRNMTVIRRSPCMDFALKGDEQPIIGDSLSVTCNGNLLRYNVKWTRGNALGAFDETILSSAKDYVIRESDYEHWLRVTVSDKAGNTFFTKDTWISKLPVLYIDTENGKPITTKLSYVTASLRIQGNAEYEQQYLGETEIKGRGATSWYQYPQKPYKLKLDKKTKLFGFDKNKHWVLTSNFNDKSCLRNYIASKLAKKLGVPGMDMTWVDVVLNGEVKGCYMLSQHVRVDKHRVDIFDWEGEAEDIANALFNAVKDTDALEEADKKTLEETMTNGMAWVTDGTVTFKGKTYNLADYGLKKEYDITEGYLFEAADNSDGQTKFSTERGVQIEVRHPEYLSTNNEMLSYVTKLWNDFEAEYCRIPPVGGKNFSKYADTESMVGMWLVNEIMGQDDQQNSRFSYIPEDKKIHFGPVWDFDHGGASWSVTPYAKIFYTLYKDRRFAYYRQWFPDPWLCQISYNAYWDVARPFILDYISDGGEMDAQYALFAEAGRTNDLLWGNYPCTLNPDAAPRTTAEDVEILRTFLREHIQWLDQQFESLETLVEAMNKYCAYPCDPKIIEVGLDCLEANRQSDKAHKVIRDGHLYIKKDGMTYSIDGKRIE